MFDRKSLLPDRRHLVVAATLALVLIPAAAGAQELIPAAYTPAPVGINLVTVTTMLNSGDMSFDPALPVEDASAEIFSSSLSYARTLSVAGRSATITAIVPWVVGDLQGIYIGEYTSVERSGLGDATLRMGLNLLGGPAMTPKQFGSYRPRTLLGASLTVRAPTGQYDSSKLINIGTNRWGFKPEIGVVQVVGRWAFDVYVGGWFYTTNTDFYDGKIREQDPILSTQAHVRYRFSRQVWAAFDVNYWRGGQTTVDGVTNDDHQSNSRVGLTVSTRFGRHHSVRFATSKGAITRIGGDFDSYGISYGFSWAKR